MKFRLRGTKIMPGSFKMRPAADLKRREVGLRKNKKGKKPEKAKNAESKQMREKPSMRGKTAPFSGWNTRRVERRERASGCHRRTNLDV